MGLGQASGAATIAATIQQMEGYYPGTPAYTNNNPGNLMYVGQAGATKSPTSSFAVFPDYDSGYQALLSQIQNYANRGLTIQQMMNIYAPATDNNGNPIPGNNPTLYATTIANALGMSPGDSVSTAIGAGGTLDPFSQAFSDIGTAVSSGDASSISGQDFLVVGGIALGLWAFAAWFK
jgi:hypothetical protein